jgi:NADH-quinone oxidoreductase subunit J
VAEITFFTAAVVAVLATGAVIFTRNIVHGLLSLVLSLLSAAVMIFLLGAPFAAALEVIIYAGAIMVLFVFAVMIQGGGSAVLDRERQWLKAITWTLPIVPVVLLVVELAVTILPLAPTEGGATSPKEVGMALFGPYVVMTVLTAMLLLAGLIGAYHLGRREESPRSLGESL